jgi:AraC-like DNA-binding protein
MERPVSDLSFIQIAPHPALRSYVDFFWMLDRGSPSADSSTHLVFPDGGMDIVVNWNVSKTSIATPATPCISGIASRSRMENLDSVAAVVGARFKPGAAFSLLSISAPDLKDTLAPLEVLVKPNQRGKFESLADARSPKDCLRQLQKALMASLSGAASIDPIVLATFQAIESSRGRIRMADLEEIGINMRTLRRRFDRFVGVGPKEFCRILRLSHAVDLARDRARSHMSWAELALVAGYYDQAHLIQNFVELAGMTPDKHFSQPAAVRFFQYTNFGAL